MNFKTIVIAGIGTIGSSVIKLGKEALDNFDYIIAVDKCAEKLTSRLESSISYRQGDIENQEFLQRLFQDIKLPALFVNLCSDVDNIRIRKVISLFDIAYIDTCASGIYQKLEYRFSKLMPYTLTTITSPFPHWLCWGINPGLVEIISRKIMKNFPGEDKLFDVFIFEHDQLDADLEKPKVAVGWSPEGLVEEVMLSPSFQVVDGKQVEAEKKGAGKILALWAGKPILSRLVGHEDVWNIGELNVVNNAKFVYALGPKVMDVFDADPTDALNTLMVPDEDVHIFGTEQVAVKVKGAETGIENTMLWEVDHEEVWRQHKVNAVQYQTSKSLLLAVMLLQHTHYGNLALNCCASSLPISPHDWESIEKLMAALDIHWTDAGHLKLHTKPYGQVG
ncbi:hypothetical protein ACFL0M_09730 [Thermodesulfobacteriota bacterium]